MSVAAAAYLKELLNNSSPVYSLDLFLQPSGILGGNYIQYSDAFWTFIWRKPVAVSICRINRTFLIYFQSKFSFPAPISKWFFLEKYTEKEIFRSIINLIAKFQFDGQVFVVSFRRFLPRLCSVWPLFTLYNVLIGYTQLPDKLGICSSQMHSISTVGAAISRPKCYGFWAFSIEYVAFADESNAGG